MAGSGDPTKMSSEPEKRRLYRRVEIWVRLSEVQVACYQCLEVLPLGKFCVQSKDFYTLPLRKDVCELLASQFLTLLSEEAPEDRAPLYDSVEEAI